MQRWHVVAEEIHGHVEAALAILATGRGAFDTHTPICDFAHHRVEPNIRLRARSSDAAVHRGEPTDDRSLDLSLAVVKDRARVATLIPSAAAAERGIAQLGFGDGADPGTELRAAARFDLVQGVDDGWLRVVVADSFPLDRAADAHRAMSGDHGAGKIVLVP